MKDLADAAIRMVIQGAKQYLEAHKLQPVSNEALAECCKSWCKINLPEALADAKEAFACHMDRIAITTFQATMMGAGIEAAKEASVPPTPSPVCYFNEADCGGVFDGFSVSSDADPGL